jgi:hypothetical protein
LCFGAEADQDQQNNQIFLHFDEFKVTDLFIIFGITSFIVC